MLNFQVLSIAQLRLTLFIISADGLALTSFRCVIRFGGWGPKLRLIGVISYVNLFVVNCEPKLLRMLAGRFVWIRSIRQWSPPTWAATCADPLGITSEQGPHCSVSPVRCDVVFEWTLVLTLSCICEVWCMRSIGRQIASWFVNAMQRIKEERGPDKILLSVEKREGKISSVNDQCSLLIPYAAITSRFSI